MADRQNQRMLQQLAEAVRQHGQSKRMGQIVAVWAKDGEQKIRVQVGIRGDGSPLLSPWLHTTDHRGDAREEQRYTLGQNVVVDGISGDWRQATVSPYAETSKLQRPVHGSDKAKTAQFDRTRRTHSGVHYDFWLAQDKDEADPDKAIGLVRIGQPPQQQKHEFKIEQQQGEGQQQDQQQQQEDEIKGVYLVKFKESITFQVGDNTFIKITDGKVDAYVGESHVIATENAATARHGTNRVAAMSGGCKMKSGTDFVVVVPGQIIVSQEPVVGDDPLPNED